MSKSSEAVKNWRKRFKARDPEGYKALRTEESRKYRSKHSEQNKLRQVRGWLRRLYGLTPEQYEQKLFEQNGVCALCGQPPIDGERLAVDHNHETGQIRALLHKMPCNIIVGYVEKYSTLCHYAADYLKRFSK